jgi:hypothetical protein
MSVTRVLMPQWIWHLAGDQLLAQGDELPLMMVGSSSARIMKPTL